MQLQLPTPSRSFIILIAGYFLLLNSLIPQVYAHGYIVGKFTRGYAKYGDPKDPKSGNWVAERGFPIPGGASPLRPEDPETLPPVSADKQLKVSPGPMQFLWQFNDGANHKGPCTAFLKSSTDKSINVDLGAQTDCARSVYADTIGKGLMIATPALQKVTIPTGYESKSGLYIVLKLEAQHVGPPYELYSDVVDIQIDKSASNAVPSDDVKQVMYGWDSPSVAQFSKSLNVKLLAAATAGSPSSPQPTNLPNGGTNVLNVAQAATPTATAGTTQFSVCSLGSQKNPTAGGGTLAAAAGTETTRLKTSPTDSPVANAAGAIVPGTGAGTTTANSGPLATAAAAVANYGTNAATGGNTGTAAGAGTTGNDCNAQWDACNAAWLSKSGTYTCQTDFLACRNQKAKRQIELKLRAHMRLSQ